MNTNATFAFAVGVLLTVMTVGPCDARPKAVIGSVTDEADAPLPNVLIELECVQSAEKKVHFSTKSDAQGHFRIEATFRGGCNARISAPGFSAVIIPVPKSRETDVRDLGKVRLRVSCSGPGVICDEVTPNRK